ncbi:hypothetical protein N658DRAFT_185390 [Parathielavia hyrcaniae]|uniref:Transmembrane protein n=1 Tax=Parathielavia hyrcaniae TaxID=113614 RepID=A0AAN6T5E1_9PEZI|nr:hypothetical protein N658DRAFT_185390 [Parathielavia hyrcaniae]
MGRCVWGISEGTGWSLLNTFAVPEKHRNSLSDTHTRSVDRSVSQAASQSLGIYGQERRERGRKGVRNVIWYGCFPGFVASENWRCGLAWPVYFCLGCLVVFSSLTLCSRARSVFGWLKYHWFLGLVRFDGEGLGRVFVLWFASFRPRAVGWLALFFFLVARAHTSASR